MLAGHPNVRQLVVTIFNTGSPLPEIAAFLIVTETIAPSALRDCCREKLPNYMASASFNFRDPFPLTTSGKNDRRRMPEPQINREQLSTGYLVPNNFERKQKTARIRVMISPLSD